MVIKYNNLRINYSFDKWQDEFLGQCEFIIKEEYFKQWLADTEDSPCDYIEQDEIDEYYSDIDNNTDFSSRNIDVFICFVHWCLEQPDKDFEIDYQGYNPYWIYHDILHAKHDCTGYEIYVTSDIEEKRLIDAFDWIDKENHFPKHYLNNELIESIEESYYQRWKIHIDLQEQKEKYLDYE